MVNLWIASSTNVYRTRTNRRIHDARQQEVSAGLNLAQMCLNRAVFTWLSKGIGFGFGFGFTTPFGWLVYLLWFWFYDSQVKTALNKQRAKIGIAQIGH